MHLLPIFNNHIDVGVGVDVMDSYLLVLSLLLGIAHQTEGEIDLSVCIENWQIKAQHMRLVEFDRGIARATEDRYWYSRLIEFLDTCDKLKQYLYGWSACNYAFLRVREITITPTCNDRNTIKCSDIFINEKGVLFIKINFSKTDQMGKSTTLVINPSKNVIANPLKYFTNYLNNRPEGEGPLFCHLNGKAVTRYQFYTVLRSALKFINF